MNQDSFSRFCLWCSVTVSQLSDLFGDEMWDDEPEIQPFPDMFEHRERHKTTNVSRNVFKVRPCFRRTLQQEQLLRRVCRPRPRPVILSVTLQPPTFMFCEGPALPLSSRTPLGRIQNQTTQTVKRISYQKQFDIHLWCLGNLHTTFSPLLPAWDSMSATGMHSLIGSASAWLQTHVGWWLTGSNLRLSYFPSCLRASEPAVYFFNVAFVTLLTVSVTPAWQLF